MLISPLRQDLYSSILIGTDRIVDHTTFTELDWKRDSFFSPSYFVLPPGFAGKYELLTDEFIEILKDIHALQCIRESPIFICEDTIEMMRVDNHQAWIASRIAGLPKFTDFQDCCNLAAYLSACMLCAKVWRASIIPVSKLFDIPCS